MPASLTLQEYMRSFVRKRLNAEWYSVEDCVQHIALMILENRQRKEKTRVAVARLIPYLRNNIMPRDKGALRTLRAMLWRGRMKYMQLEDRARTGSWKKRYYDDDVQSAINSRDFPEKQ